MSQTLKKKFRTCEKFSKLETYLFSLRKYNMHICLYILRKEQSQVQMMQKLCSLTQEFWGAAWLKLMPSVSSVLVSSNSLLCWSPNPHYHLKQFILIHILSAPFWPVIHLFNHNISRVPPFLSLGFVLYWRSQCWANA